MQHKSRRLNSFDMYDRRRCARLLFCALITTGVFVRPARAEDYPDTVFCIGTPDASPGEFGLVREGYAGFTQVFNEPVAYTVGKSKTTA